MTIQINIGDHTSTQAGYLAVPSAHRSALRWARSKASAIAQSVPGADVYFRTLPNGRSLRQLLADSSIWINYAPTLNDWGETNFAGGKEIAIGVSAFRMGRWSVLATLIHELAHVDGVVGSVSPMAAEDALLACGLGKRSERSSGIDDPSTPFDPRIRG